MFLQNGVLEKAQRLLDQGYSRKDAARRELGIKYDTLRKAINDGRLIESRVTDAAIAKSSRNVVDVAAADDKSGSLYPSKERILASLGKMVGAAVRFDRCLDVPKAGVLCALPALLANGLLNGAQQFLGQLKGYYTTFHVLKESPRRKLFPKTVKRFLFHGLHVTWQTPMGVSTA